MSTRNTRNSRKARNARTILPLEYFTSKEQQKNLNESLKIAEKYNVNDAYLDNYQHRCHQHIKDKFFSPASKKNLVLFQSIISLKTIIPYIHNKDLMEENMFNIGCGVLDKKRFEKYVYSDQILLLNLKLAMLQKKTAFVMLVFEDYGINDEDDDDNIYLAHSACLVLTPEKESYSAYYINPHGSDMVNTDCFDLIITRRRSKRIQFDKPLDIVFLEKYIGFINDFKLFGPDEDVITFTNNNEHVYNGADLQGGDYEGVCFVYPMIIWYYFGKYFNSTREIKTAQGTIKMKKGKTLLKHGKLNLFIESMFIDFSEKYKELVVNDLLNYKTISSKNLNILIEKEEKIFTSSLVDRYISFITQEAMENKIQKYFEF